MILNYFKIFNITFREGKKNKWIVLFFTFVFTFYNGFSQKMEYGKIIYGQKMHDTSVINQKKIPENILNIIKHKITALKENSERINYELIFNNYNSIFKAQEIMDIDNQESLNNCILAADANGEWYLNLENNKSIRSLRFLDEKIIIKYPEINDWVVSNETKKISGWNCFKAKKKKVLDNGNEIEIVAWFTTEIPINLGPKNYNGLPGLIVELIENKFTFYIKTIPTTYFFCFI